MLITPSILLRTMVAQFFMYTGILNLQLRKRAKKRESVILMYHRVVEPSKTDEYLEPGMYVTPATFQMHINLLSRNFEIVSLQQLVTTSDAFSNKPKCAITFDDGWIDIYKNVYPILEGKKIPATIFLPTNYIGTKHWFWTDRLATILKQSTSSSPHLSPNTLASKITQLSGSHVTRVDMAIKLLKQLPQENIIKVLEELEQHMTATNIIQKRAFLDWNECRTLKKSGYVSFGSHTAKHIILTTENEQTCREELEISKRKLLDEKVVAPTFIPFCYPNGNYTEEYARIVEKTGYHCAVTTRSGWIDEKSNRFTLTRVGIHQDITSTQALFSARIASR